MFRHWRINPCEEGEQHGPSSGDGVPFGTFSLNYKNWSRLELSLTCRQGDFAEDLSEQGMQTQASGTN
jgi:hypothetical protein